MTVNDTLTIQEIILTIGTAAAFLLLYKGNLKIGPLQVCAIWAAEVAVTVLVYCLIDIRAGSLLDTFYLAIFPLVTLREKVLNNWVCIFLWIMIYNMATLTLSGSVFMIQAFLKGDASWYDRTTAGITNEILLIVSGVIGMIIAYVCVKWLMPTIMDFRSGLLGFLVIMVPILCTVRNIMQPFIIDLDTYILKPEGTGLIIDTTNMIGFVVAFVMILFHHRRRVISAGDMVADKEELESKYDHDTKDLQRQARELRHDLNNITNLNEKKGGREINGQTMDHHPPLNIDGCPAGLHTDGHFDQG